MPDEKTGVIERIFTRKKSADEAPASAAGADPSAADLAALKSQAKKSGRRPSKSEVAVQDAAKEAALEELFDNENWEVIASMYFELRFAMTGFEYFRLTEKQERVLGKSMGTCMKLLLAIDPQWVALIVFTANFGAYAADKELAYRRALKELEVRRMREEGVAGNGRQG